MKAIEIIQNLTKGLVPIDKCGTCKFETSDLSELTAGFGAGYTWFGHMFKGNVFYVIKSSNDDWYLGDWNIYGCSLANDSADVYLFHVSDD